MDDSFYKKMTNLVRENKKIIDILLRDMTTKKNIIWATDMYASHGDEYSFNAEIKRNHIFFSNDQIIKPRINKTKSEQESRIKNNAEVFTPLWVCNEQNNLIDENLFSKKDVFNKAAGKKWETNKEKIAFTNGITWLDYINDKRLEITCGEAPYLVSRYDPVKGDFINPIDRIGILDRKIRVVNENISSQYDWIKYALLAYKNVYGFEWQGDSLYIARENMMITFFEYYFLRFNDIPKLEVIIEFAKVISWNIWQMDGMKHVVPNSCSTKISENINLFGEKEAKIEKCQGCLTGVDDKHNGIYTYIMDWDTGRKLRFVDMINSNK